jgi:miniconductance mechanosensitive channel
VYEKREVARSRPIKGYVQLAQIVLSVIGIILIIAMLIDRSPLLLLSGLGAMTAVLLLVFKDTVLSFVASLQLIGQDMVRVGDWIEMPQAGADGDVIDVALHMVTVQNWDKTITRVPTYRLISESFKNWRGMNESGGRRIKRSIVLDLTSIRFLDDDTIEHLRGFSLLHDYIVSKQAALIEANAHVADGLVVNRRRLTNIGCFRAYVLAYLQHHAGVHQGMTILVNQLDPGPQGLPLQLYCFTSTVDWIAHENIKGDIFDHLLAILPEFGLTAFQQPAGADFRALLAPSDPA